MPCLKETMVPFQAFFILQEKRKLTIINARRRCSVWLKKRKLWKNPLLRAVFNLYQLLDSCK